MLSLLMQYPASFSSFLSPKYFKHVFSLNSSFVVNDQTVLEVWGEKTEDL